MPRKLKVQTPGAPAPAPVVDTTTQPETPTETQAAAPAPVVTAEPADKAPATPKTKAPASYRDMRATDIDPAKLTAPVLSLDGWVMPPAKTAPHPAARD